MDNLKKIILALIIAFSFASCISVTPIHKRHSYYRGGHYGGYGGHFHHRHGHYGNNYDMPKKRLAY